MSNFLNRPWLILGVGALVVGGVVVGQTFKPNQKIFGGNGPISLRPAGLDTGVDLSNLKLLDATYSALAESATKGVVFITGESNPKAPTDPMSQYQGTKSGSGFVYRSDGWIVTNDHVVAGYDKVTIVLADGREVVGKVTRANDPDLDLAVVKVDENDLPALSMGDSGKIRIGQMAMAIGAPYGLDETVTFGHVSATGRPGRIPDPSTGQLRSCSGLIQTDAAMNPGNSGGPLFNVEGEVIGVNSAINSQSGSSAGIGFAIPSNVVRAIADELISTGKFDRGLMGLAPRDLKPFEMKKFNLQGGAFVAVADAGTPAHKAGIRVNDIITTIDNVPISKEIDLRIAMYKSAPGKSVNVSYIRDGKTNTASVTLIAPPKQEAAQQRMQREFSPFQNNPQEFFGQPDDQNRKAPDLAPKGAKPKLGVMVQQIDADSRKQFNIPNDASGVVVATVADGSFAAKVNLQPGDLLLDINGKKVATVEDLTSAMSGVNWGDQVSLKFVRYKNSSRSEYTVTIPFK